MTNLTGSSRKTLCTIAQWVRYRGPKVVGGQSCGAYPGIDAPILDLRILEIPERQKLDPCMRSATSLCPGHRRIFCKVLSPLSSTIAQTGRSSGAKVTACFPAH